MLLFLLCRFGKWKKWLQQKISRPSFLDYKNWRGQLRSGAPIEIANGDLLLGSERGFGRGERERGERVMMGRKK